MAKLYTRTSDGLITYHGENRMSKEATIESKFGMIPDKFRSKPEIVEVTGWLHARIEWHDNIGFGVE